MSSYTAQEICDRVAGRLVGPAYVRICGVDALEAAQEDQISFIASTRYAQRWDSSRACAALVGPGVDVEATNGRALIHVDDIDIALATVLGMFAPSPPHMASGVHATAVVDPTARLGKDVAVGPGTVIGPHCQIGDRTVIHANVTILDHSRLGSDCCIWPGVVIRERCDLADRCILHPNVTIGADGFGYCPGRPGVDAHPRHTKIPHIGTVKIGCDVEIGAGTCVDRGKFAATIIGDGTKIDNLCTIAHNCRIGHHCVLAGQVGVAGSVTIGDWVVMGGKAGIRDHVTIGAGAKIAAYAAVMNSIPPGEAWAGYPAQKGGTALRQEAALRKLPGLLRRLRALGRGGDRRSANR